MLQPIELSLPARPEWGMIAQNVVLSYASTAGMGSSRLHDLGLVIGQLWDEVAYSPGVVHTKIRSAFAENCVRLEVEGTGDSELGDLEVDNGWSSLLVSQVVGHLAKEVSLQRSPQLLRIEAVFSLLPAD